MTTRMMETSLAKFTLGCLVVYVPVEVWTSLPYGLTHPMFLVDVVAMILLLWASLASLRARPGSAAGLLAAGWAWTSANGWRATSWRWLEIRQGGELDLGSAELLGTGIGTLIALICLSLSLWLCHRSAFPDSK